MSPSPTNKKTDPEDEIMIAATGSQVRLIKWLLMMIALLMFGGTIDVPDRVGLYSPSTEASRKSAERLEILEDRIDEVLDMFRLLIKQHHPDSAILKELETMERKQRRQRR